MDVTRRDFLTLLTVAGAPGGRGPRARAAPRLPGARERDLAAHDRPPRDAPARALPRARHTDRRGRRGGQPPLPHRRGPPQGLWDRAGGGGGPCPPPGGGPSRRGGGGGGGGGGPPPPPPPASAARAARYGRMGGYEHI